ncbi:DUF1415 domain-containing protein [Coralloluteibacterium thermophilus]|uniref:DUF1415 domain-containing protein n=1 Tax=Coralloluteibacterium thermophilum TaxID=2707049 RepID=A0ABV9NKV6_9GAMM
MTALPNDAPDDAAVLAATRDWVERAVVGLNLCPFARAPLVRGRLRMRVSHARDEDALLGDLDAELGLLAESDPQEIETTLLVHPGVLQAFDAYNAFLDIADLAVRMRGLEGVVQVASFHPHYRFADAPADAIENFTNRSPYPILHLLRESSIDAAVAAVPDTDAIYQRNIETLRRLGRSGWDALWRTPDADA